MYNTATFAVTILSTFSCWVRFCSCHFSLFFHMFWYVIIMYFACRNYQRERDRLEILLKISELSRTAFLSFPLLVGLTILGNFVFYKASLTMNNVNRWKSHHILQVLFYASVRFWDLIFDTPSSTYLVNIMVDQLTMYSSLKQLNNKYFFFVSLWNILT